MSRRKPKRAKQPSARALFAECTAQIALLNRRYEGLFRFAHDPNVYESMRMSETITVTMERDMKAGEALTVRLPMKFTI